jgi:molybdopterin/thiamine biosynthesis adenylyltransferase
MSTPSQQNALMLASLLGVGEAEAVERLKRNVLITAQPGWKTRFANEVAELLGRTLIVQAGLTAIVPDFELVIGDIAPRTTAKRLFADIDRTGFVIAEDPHSLRDTEPHRLYAAAAACAATAAALWAAIEEAALPMVRLPLRLDFSQLGVPAGGLERRLDLTGAVMAGAGAIAHGFLRAARHLDLHGELTIVDPKTVKGGILNRCLYLQEEDIESDKATALALRAQADFPDLRLIPNVADFRKFVKKLSRPPETVLVTVDSRAARRAIQLEVPHRIIDASTTDVRGVVVHSNTLPTDHACLACIYRHVPEEFAREKSIADGLGVDLQTVQSGFIDEAAAERIAVAHPSIDPLAIRGMAYDSLFRQLCSEQALTLPEGRQVLAPFAFVSAWAGVLLAVEMLRSFAGDQATNYWSVDPWRTPLARGRTTRPKHDQCQLCSNPAARSIIAELWGNG